MAEVALAAEVRDTQGSSASRRLRAAGKVPGVLYGHGIEPTPLAVAARSLRLVLNTDAGLNALIQLDLDGKRHLALARDVQRHPVRNTVAHVDFQIVRRDEVMAVDVPINFIGEAEGVTKQGGVVEHLLQALHVSATPTSIPSHIDVDISELQLDGAIRIKDIVFPPDVTSLGDDEEPIAVGKPSRVTVATDAEAAAAVEAGEGAASTTESSSES